MRKKKILFISPDCYPIRSAEAIVNYKFVSALRENGYFVTVISQEKSSHIYPKLNLPESKHNLSISVPNGKNFKNLFFHFLAYIKTGYLLPSSQFIYNANIIATKHIKRNSYDLILCSNHPGPLLGLYLTKKFNIPLGVIWNDPFPESKYPNPYSEGYNSKLASNWVNYLDDIQEHISYNFFANDRLRKYMFKYLLKLKDKKYMDLGHIIDINNEYKDNKNKCFRLIHSGNLKMPRNPVEFLYGFHDFVKEMQLRKNEIKLDFIGLLDDSNLDLIKKLNLSEFINIIPPIDYFETREKLNDYDLGIIIEAQLEEGIFLPSKLADYIQARLPILSFSPNNGVINDIFKNYGGGELCNSRENTCKKLMILYKLWEENKLQDKYLKKSLFKRFSPETIIHRFNKIFEE